MNLREHLLYSSVLAASLYARQPVAAALLIAGGVLIDLDHLALYVCRTGDWSISGALLYNRYRNQFIRHHDNRPRYGSLRSWLHQPLFVLPPLWRLAQRYPWFRPFAIGVAFHLLLDHLPLPLIWAAYWRAGGRCARCGNRQQIEVYRRPRFPDQRMQWVALCRQCANKRMWYTDHDTHATTTSALPND